MVLPYVVKSKDFKNWLLSFSSNEIVGIVGSGERCPMKRYLDNSGLALSAVGTYHIITDIFGGQERRNLIDEHGNSYSPVIVAIDTHSSPTITAGSVLKIMELIYPDLFDGEKEANNKLTTITSKQVPNILDRLYPELIEVQAINSNAKELVHV